MKDILEAILDEDTEPGAFASLPVPESYKGITVHKDEEGMFAGLAAREVEGVHHLVDTGLGKAVVGIARAVARQANRDQGILVEVGEKEAAVDVRLCAEYGVNIPAVAAAVRNNVSSRVESMTGLLVKEVNVAVVDLYFPEEEEEAPTRRVE